MNEYFKKTINGVDVLVEVNSNKSEMSLYILLDNEHIFECFNFGTMHENYKVKDKGVGKMMVLLKKLHLNFRYYISSDKFAFETFLSIFEAHKVKSNTIEDVMNSNFTLTCYYTFFIDQLSNGFESVDYVKSLCRKRSAKDFPLVEKITDSYKHKKLSEMNKAERINLQNEISDFNYFVN